MVSIEYPDVCRYAIDLQLILCTLKEEFITNVQRKIDDWQEISVQEGKERIASANMERLIAQSLFFTATIIQTTVVMSPTSV